MAKSEMNNEFISLRHAVRQARVCIVNKLIKEAKLLRDRHGKEAQREKCARKADKLIAEVYALKTIKDDEISKFGILNERSRTEVLQDQSSSSSVRIMARVAHYGNLNRRLMQFKEKFPDCKKHLAEKKKKTTKLKDKSAGRAQKSKENNPQNKSSKKQKVDSEKNTEQSQHNSKDEESHNGGSRETRSNSQKRKKSLNEDSTSLGKQKLLKLEEDGTSKDITDMQSNVIKSCVTKEATVKRFAELLEEQETNQNAQTPVESQNRAGTTTEQAQMVDDFFITGDNQNYQGNSASTSYTTSHRHYTRAKTFQLNNGIKKHNANHKNDTNFNKKHPDRHSFAMKSKKMASNKINKNVNKSNINENAIVNKKDENVNLHPSWLVKKKQQEIMSQGFQGKKIVFTDD